MNDNAQIEMTNQYIECYFRHFMAMGFMCATAEEIGFASFVSSDEQRQVVINRDGITFGQFGLYPHPLDIGIDKVMSLMEKAHYYEVSEFLV